MGLTQQLLVLFQIMLSLLLLKTLPCPAVEPDRLGTGNVAFGKSEADNGRCLECHGANGISVDDRIPNHAGQVAGYLEKQLLDFQSGKRKHPTMTLMAEDLSAAEITNISSYFAGLTPADNNQGNDYPLAKKLFMHGDQARSIPACATCHGPEGKGQVKDRTVFPRLAGQTRVYLRSQIMAWQMGDRQNSPDGIMNKIAKDLSIDEVNALVNYLTEL